MIEPLLTKRRIILTLVAILILSWVYRYEYLAHGYMLDRWTNTTIPIDSLEREDSFLSKLLDEWSTSSDLRLEIQALKRQLKQAETRYNRLRSWNEIINAQIDACKKD